MDSSLGSKKIVPLVIFMALPTIFSMAMQAIYNIADSLFISHYSEIAFGGVSIIQPLLLIATALANGIAAGVGSYLSASLGAKDEKRAISAISTGWALALSSGVAISLLLLIIARPFVSLFSDNIEASVAASSYLLMTTPFLICVFISSLICFILQSYGRPKLAMVIQSLGAVVNIVLDPIFIFTFNMGAMGAALATGIGYFVSFVLSLIFYYSTDCIHCRAKFDRESIVRIFNVALPSTMTQGAGPIVGVIINGLVVSYGIEVMAVYGMYLKAESFMFLASQGIANALIVIVGYNYGRGDFNRVRKSFKVSLVISWSLMIVGFVIFQIFARQIVSLFTTDVRLIELGVSAFRSLCFCFLLTAPNIVMTGLLQGLGKGGLSLTITYTRFFVFLIPLSFVLNWIWGLSGLWFCYFSADIPTIFLIVFIYRYIDKKVFLK